MTKVKICGLKSAEAVAAAATADFAGFLFFAKSPRGVTAEQAAALAEPLPAAVRRVGLLVDPDDATLRATLAVFRADMIQLHGKETPARVAEIRKTFAVPVMKVMAVGEPADVAAARAYEDVADWLMFDARPPQRPGALPGGNAVSFDWSLLAGQSWKRPWMLAGGLTPENVGEAIRAVRPPAVDVSSGVEDRPGVKSVAKIKAFLAAARAIC